MSASPLLSICIPTYNRDKYLEACLESITDQLIDPLVHGQVEVVISDNASTDSTSTVVANFQKKLDSIYYFRNKTNLGFDRNLLHAVSHARGVYCLTLGDDDALFPDALAVLLKKLETLNVPYLQLNNWGHDHELKYPIPHALNRNLPHDQYFETLADFVRTIRGYAALVGTFGGMSVQVFDRSIWEKFDRKEDFVGSQIVHTYTLLSIFKDTPFVLIAMPMVKTRADNIRWDICPGMETHAKRVNATTNCAMWISNNYDLGLSRPKVWLELWGRACIIIVKNYIKAVLRVLGLRK